MRSGVRTFCVLFLVLFLGSLLGPGASAKKKAGDKPADESPAAEISVGPWLLLGPVAHPLPVFHDADKGGFELERLLDDAILPSADFRPRDGGAAGWFTGETLTWASGEADEGGDVALRAPDGEGPGLAWLATYLSVDRWSAYDLKLLGKHPRRVWLDGEPLAKGGSGKSAEKPVEAKVELTTGKHLLLVETVFDPEGDEEWSVGVTLGADEGDEPPRVAFSLDPARPVNLADILDAPRIGSLATSPDGKHVVVGVRQVVPGSDDSESWLEIRRTSDGSLAESWRGGLNARSVAWSPDGRYISYVADAPGKKDDKASALYLYEREAGRVRPLLDKVKRLGSYLWSPTGRNIVFSTTVKAEKDKRGVKLVQGIADRWASYRDKQFLHLVAVPGGSRRQLTAGELTTSAVAFSADGRRLLFSRRIEELEQRPYSRSELWELSLEDFTARKLRDFRFFNGAIYSPDGQRILIAADATAFDGAGLDLSEGVTPNSYDGQLYLWNPASDEVEAITRDFDPAVGAVEWSRHDGAIYLTAEDGDRVRLYRYDTGSAAFTVLETGFDRVRPIDLAARAPLAVVVGSSAWTPQTLVAVDLSSGAARPLDGPGDEWFADVRPGLLEEWEFSASNGRTIPGRVYLPPDFDASRKYPAIVYYYAGTSPVTREFGGRYPKEWWAANGYVVYVLQPSGATGFGQERSATHVNDWGKVTTQEIVEGTRAFLEAHPYVDPERVGCIGASYGGFTTMLLSTQTDLYAAAVSHAGISSLASYWGEGYWGYSYSSVATAGSYPWNRQDIYVDNSPIFHADKVNTPILLTHGTSDPNVPPGESDQFFTALRILGKEVEYLRVADQEHWMLDHAKRLQWSESIVAWFDHWLKDSPEWWNAMYPEPGEDGNGD